ncbi:hypothetical protein [Streptococcus suis]|uniref:hypothetical protein n=1 Tax=Streptococcus suis TaxID=1307 RepID=UPI0038BCE990
MKVLRKLIVVLSACAVLFTSFASSYVPVVYAGGAITDYVSSREVPIEKGGIVPLDRGVCGDFANVPWLHNRYCNRPTPPGRNLTARERNCVIAFLGGAFGILTWSNPITWKQVVSTFGPALLTCVLG